MFFVVSFLFFLFFFFSFRGVGVVVAGGGRLAFIEKGIYWCGLWDWGCVEYMFQITKQTNVFRYW